jgi:hypothetical protein
MLLWEGGLIKVEVSRKKKKHCHAAPITQFEIENGDLTTVGMDELYISFHFILFSIHICYYSNTWTSHNVRQIIPGIHLPSGRGLKFVNSNHNLFITYNLDKNTLTSPNK